MTENNRNDRIRNLIHKYRKLGNPESGNLIYRETEKFVWSIVHKFGKQNMTDEDRNDLFQSGCVGLVHAIREYNLQSKNAFSSFAYFKILREITRAYNDLMHLIAIPYNNVAQLKQFMDLTIDYMSTTKLTLSHMEYIMQNMGIKDFTYWRLYDAVQFSNVGQLDHEVSNKENAPRLADVLTREQVMDGYGIQMDSINPEERAIEAEKAAVIEQIASDLTPTQHLLIMQRLMDFDKKKRPKKLTKLEQAILAPLQDRICKLLG